MLKCLPSALVFLLIVSAVLDNGQQWGLCQIYPDLSDPCASSATQLHDGDVAYFPSRLLSSDNEQEQPTADRGEDEEERVRRRRGATSERHKVWPGGIVYYTISNRFTASEVRTILEAMKHWEDRTCIRFKERTTQLVYINYFPGSGCCSYVGRIGYGRQGVSLSRSCFVFHSVLHEIGHVVGFWHEQSRPDRDEHVEVIHGNIAQNYQINFRKLPSTLIDSQGVGYDYNSIMHYNSNFFSRHTSLDTLRARDPTIPIGQATVLSEFDIEQTNRLYKCDPENLPPPSITLPPTLPAPSSPFPALPYRCGFTMKTISGSFDSPSYPNYGSNVDCVWMVKVPDGYQIRLTFSRVEMESTYECYKDYIKVYNNFQRRGNSRSICGNYYSYHSSVSGSSLLVHYHTDSYNDYSPTVLAGFTASYQSVDVNECLSAPCSHGCRNFIGSYECTCPRGFYLSADGQNCFDMNECALGNGGCDHKCVNTGGSFRCECNLNYELLPDGHTCRLPGTTCRVHKGGCHHICTETPTTKICSCNSGYELYSDGTSCLDINECYGGQSGCQHRCTNTLGSYFCYCRAGYKLNHDNHTCSLERTCANENGECAQVCRDTHLGAVCSCERGYRLAKDQRLCEEINECEEDRNICQQICTNTNGSYTCSCSEGYALRTNNRGCSDVNECRTGENQCRFQNYCINTYGSYLCRCPSGYTHAREGHGCDDIDECAIGYHYCSHVCRNVPGSFECQCPSGYILQDTYTCRDIDECASRSHQCNRLSGALCENTMGSYLCTCPDGYSIDSSGLTCIDSAVFEFECESIEECDEGFICQDSEEWGHRTCQCPSGYQLSEDQLSCEDVRSTTDNIPTPDVRSTVDNIQTTPTQMVSSSTYLPPDPKRTTTESPSSDLPMTDIKLSGNKYNTPTVFLVVTPTQVSTTNSHATSLPTTVVGTTTMSKMEATPSPQTTSFSAELSETQEISSSLPTTVVGTTTMSKMEATPSPQTTSFSTEFSEIQEISSSLPTGGTSESLTTKPELSSSKTTETSSDRLITETGTMSQPFTATPSAEFITTTETRLITETGTMSQPFTATPNAEFLTTTETSSASDRLITETRTMSQPFTATPNAEFLTTTGGGTTASPSFATSLSPTTIPSTVTTPTPEPQCGGKLTQVNGSFQTINWPETYPVNIDCEWKIELPDTSKVVGISFDSTAFGVAGRLPDCVKDWIKVYDGHSYNDTWWGPYCWFWQPKPIQTKSNKAMLSFHSGPRHTRSRKGFRAFYTSLDKPTIEPPEVTTENEKSTTGLPDSATTTIDSATTTIDSATTTIDSATTIPIPQTKPPDTSSTSISSPDGLTTNQPGILTTESSPYTVPQTTKTPDISEEVCNVPPPPLKPEGLFHCHLFVSPNHKFGPPEFPNMISTQRTCYWRLIGLQNIRNYQLRILYFDLPMSTNCSNSSLKVYNGFSTAIHVEPLATLCGYLAPDRRVVKGRGQAMTAMLTVNTQENNFRGFHAVFEEIPIEDVHLNP